MEDIDLTIIKALNTHFRGIFFAPLALGKPEKKQTGNKQPRFFFFPSKWLIKPYLIEKDGVQEWDIQAMAENLKNKNILMLFPEQAVPDKNTWEQYKKWLRGINSTSKAGTAKDDRLGGIIRFFIERDDYNFVKGFNALASDNKKIMDELMPTNVLKKATGVPGNFFIDLNRTSTYAEYDEKKGFRWDFSRLLINKPITIYEAYWRYAHAKYSIRFIGEDKYQKFYEKRIKILNGFLKKLYEKKEPDDKNKIELYNDKILKCISRTLEGYSDGEQYKPLSLDEFEKRYKIEWKWSKKRKQGIYSRAEIQTLKDYCGQNKKYKGITMPKVLSKLGLEQEKEIFLEEIRKRPFDSRTYPKMDELYRLIKKYSEVKKAFGEQAATIEELYMMKSRRDVSFNDELNVGDDGEISELTDVTDIGEEKHPDDSTPIYHNPEETFLLKEQSREKLDIILPFLTEQFKFDEGFVNYLNDESPRILLQDIGNYFKTINAKDSKDKEIEKKAKGKHTNDTNFYGAYSSFSAFRDNGFLLMPDKFKVNMQKLQKRAKKHLTKQLEEERLNKDIFDTAWEILFPKEVTWNY